MRWFKSDTASFIMDIHIHYNGCHIKRLVARRPLAAPHPRQMSSHVASITARSGAAEFAVA